MERDENRTGGRGYSYSAKLHHAHKPTKIREAFTALQTDIAQIAAGMQDVELVYAGETVAKQDQKKPLGQWTVPYNYLLYFFC